MQEEPKAEAAPAAVENGAAAEPAAPAAIDPEQKKRQLMSLVPKDKDKVFAWPLRWDLLDRAPEDVSQRIQGRAVVVGARSISYEAGGVVCCGTAFLCQGTMKFVPVH